MKKGAVLHIIVPTLRCNQKCIYCHSSARFGKEKEYDMDKETAKKTLEFISIGGNLSDRDKQAYTAGYLYGIQLALNMLNVPERMYDKRGKQLN